MSALRIGLVGSTGRMGTALLRLISGEKEYGARFDLVYASNGPKDPEFPMMERLNPQVIIDFSAPETTLAAAKLCAKGKTPLLVCTTGFSDDQKASLQATMKGVAWALVPNTSLGVHALSRAVEAALKLLPSTFSVSIVESHHRMKKDKPSGTAKALREQVRQEKKWPEPEVHSLRGGTEVGEHTLVLLGPGERIELSHRALDRSLFARGALELAAKLYDVSLKNSAGGEPLSAADLYDADS